MIALDVRKPSQVTCEITSFHLSEVADIRGVPDALVTGVTIFAGKNFLLRDQR
jgi:hypothetical protein